MNISLPNLQNPLQFLDKSTKLFMSQIIFILLNLSTIDKTTLKWLLKGLANRKTSQKKIREIDFQIKFFYWTNLLTAKSKLSEIMHNHLIYNKK